MERGPKTQEVMGWRIAASLFLVAAGAGAYLIGFVFNMMLPGFVGLSKIAVVLAAPVVFVGGLLLLCDMGRKAAFYRAFLRPGSSWMALGSIFLTAFIVLDLVHIFTWVWPSTGLAGAPHLILGIIISIIAVLCLIYTGLLLGVVKSIPFWSASNLPVLFLFSGLSMGTMAVVLVFSIYKLSTDIGGVQVLVLMARFNFFLIIVEAIIIGTYLIGMRRLDAAKNSVTALTRGRLAGQFWGSVVVAALVVPFILEAIKAFVPMSPMAVLTLAIAPSVIGLIGGYMLRHVIVYAGTRVLLNIQGVLVAPPPEKYETRVLERSSFETFQKA